MSELATLKSRLSGCTICADRFAATATRHAPRPVVWFDRGARILIASQAPGLRAHESRTPFDDRSGDRLREWMGIGRDVFYDTSKLAIVPMGFCFPGYDAAKSDLPPPRVCAETWRAPILEKLGELRLTLLIGGYAQRWHLGGKENVTETVRGWPDAPPGLMALPHPSWRNTGWMKRNPWFEAEVLPVLRTRVAEALA